MNGSSSLLRENRRGQAGWQSLEESLSESSVRLEAWLQSDSTSPSGRIERQEELLRLAEVFAWGGSVAIIILTCVVVDPRGWRVLKPLAIITTCGGLSAYLLKPVVARWRRVGDPDW